MKNIKDVTYSATDRLVVDMPETRFRVPYVVTLPKFGITLVGSRLTQLANMGVTILVRSINGVPVEGLPEIEELEANLVEIEAEGEEIEAELTEIEAAEEDEEEADTEDGEEADTEEAADEEEEAADTDEEFVPYTRAELEKMDDKQIEKILADAGIDFNPRSHLKTLIKLVLRHKL